MPLSTTQTVTPQSVTAPAAQYKFYQPYFEDYQRRLGASAFGSNGIGGLMNQAQPIPMEGTAGLTPLQMQARQAAMSAGPDMGAYNTATNLMGQGAGMIGQGADALGTAQGMYGQGTNLVGQGSGLYGLGTQMTGQAANMFAPGAAQQFYNPYEDQVIDDTLQRMRKTSAQQDIAGRAQDISSGAFGGSRGRLLAGERQAESERGILQALSGIRSQGYQQAQQAAQTAGQGLGSLAGQLGQFGQGLGTLGGQLGQFGQGLTSTGGQYGQLGQQIGQLGQGVAGLGQQKSGELANYSNLLNALGTQGQTTQQGGLSRLYQAAKQRADEPWNRLMKGQTLLSGMKPGELIGGYNTAVPNTPPTPYQQPTSSGNIVDFLTGFADVGQGFNWWGGQDKAAGGFMEKPKEYNAGGIVSGIVPINMQEGGDAAQEMMDDLPSWVKEAMDSDDFFERKAAMDYISTVGAIDLNPISDLTEEGIEKAGMSGTGLEALLLSAMAAGKVKKGNIVKAGQQGKKSLQAWRSLLDKKLRERAAAANARKAAEREAKRKAATIGGPKTPKPALSGPKAGPKTSTGPVQGPKAPNIVQRIKQSVLANKGKSLFGGAVAGSGLYMAGKSMFGGDDEEVVTTNPEEFDEYLRLKQEQIAEAESKEERDELMADIIRTGNRLSTAMSAEGFKEVTLGEAGRIFGEERLNLPEKKAAKLGELEETAKAAGMSLQELMELSSQEELNLRGVSKEALAEKILQTGYARYGANFEGHPDHTNMGGTKSGAQIRLEMMNSLMGLGYQDLSAYLAQLESEIEISAQGG